MQEIIKRLPFVRKFKNKFDRLEKQISDLKNENNFLAREAVQNRIAVKILQGKKINIVFVCHRPAVWGSLENVCTALKNDDLFDVKIVAIPNKRELPDSALNHEEYISENAEEFWKTYGCINGYDYETREWLDLRTLHPDYVFFQQPYNIDRSSYYKSFVVSKYAKLCYVHYASNFIGSGILEESTPMDFVQNVSMFFTQNEIDDKLIRGVLKKYGNNFTKTFLTGFPRYDGLEKYKDADSSLWNYPRSDNKFRIIWTPRWCTNEGNCHFFDYKDKLLDYCAGHPEIDFIFRPHPQAFIGLNATGELPEKEAAIYKAEYDKHPNTKIDNSKEYLTTFYSSDCMITDISSIVAEYFLTGKPIIYCHKKDCFNDFSRKLSEGFYWVRNWQELERTLQMLKSGDDPLKAKRQELIKSEFQISTAGAGNTIAALIKKDALGDLA